MGQRSSAGVLAAMVWLLLAVSPTGDAHAAEAQTWTRLDLRLPLDSGASGNSLWSLRLQTHLRMRWDDPGVALLALRGGPQWRPNDWFRLAVNGYVAAARRSDGLVSDYRVELEPTVQFPVGPLRMSNRLRIEERWSDDGRRPMRYRDQLAVGFRWTDRFEPGAYGEAFLTQGQGFSQFRVFGGVKIHLEQRGTVEVGYLQARRSDDDWSAIHALNLVWAP